MHRKMECYVFCSNVTTKDIQEIVVDRMESSIGRSRNGGSGPLEDGDDDEITVIAQRGGCNGSMAMGSASSVVDEEPIYVNARQYDRILKRRAARAKLELEGRIPKQRRVSDSIDDFEKDFLFLHYLLPVKNGRLL